MCSTVPLVIMKGLIVSRRNSFYLWLMAQIKRDDPVGDLARDVKGDPSAPQYAFRERSWKRHLENNYACEGALQALKCAFDEFAQHNS